MVYAEWAVKDAYKTMDRIDICENIPDWNDEGTSHPGKMILITQSLKEVRLKRACDRLWIIYNETEKLYRSGSIFLK